MKRIFCISFLLFFQSNIFAQWVQTSGPSGGGVSEFAYTNHKILAATVDVGNGVYASTDNGVSWHESGLQGISIAHIAAHGDVVIASSTHNSYTGTDTVYWSNTAGANWKKVAFYLENDTLIGIIPNISGIGSICYHNSQWYISAQGENGQIFVSDDDGEIWTPIQPNFNYAYPVILLSTGVKLLAGTNDNGYVKVYQTTDGKLWDTSTVSFATKLSAEIYCGAVSGSSAWLGTTGGIIVSRNDGGYWETSLTLKNQGEYIAHIDGRGNKVVAISSLGNIYRTESGGAFWDTLIGNGLNASGYLYSVSFSAFDTTIFFGTSAGTISSGTLGYQWQYSTDGLLASPVINIAMNNGTIFVATERGVSYSTNTGSSWHEPQTLLDLYQVPITGFLSGSNNFYAFGSGLYRWESASWKPIASGLITALAEGASGKLFAARRSGDPITGTGEIAISADNGVNWSSDLSFTNSFDTEFYFMPHCVVSNNGSTILAIRRAVIFESFLSEYSVYRSTDNGDSWNVASSVNAPAMLYYADNAFYLGTYGDGFYRSVDNGSTWVKCSSLTTGIDVTSILRISSTLFISVTGNGNNLDGLYSSSDEGATWKYANYGNTNISGMLANDETYVYGGGPSVWRRLLQELAVHETIAQPNTPLEIYPNPAESVIHVHFTSSKPVKGLYIYDEKGSIISKQENFVEDNMEDISMSVAGIPDGAYYAKLLDGNGMVISTSKFVVEKK